MAHGLTAAILVEIYPPRPTTIPSSPSLFGNLPSMHWYLITMRFFTVSS